MFATAAGFILLSLAARWVNSCLMGQWFSGIAVIGFDTGFDLGLIARNDKLLAKLTVLSPSRSTVYGSIALLFHVSSRRRPSLRSPRCCRLLEASVHQPGSMRHS